MSLLPPYPAFLFPSSWFPQRAGTSYSRSTNLQKGFRVSIQLVSPASGDMRKLAEMMENPVEFPFNWFPQRVGTSFPIPTAPTFLCGRFPFNWFPQRVGTSNMSTSLSKKPKCFHSIGFPSEWGHPHHRIHLGDVRRVSIQLVSPASGDHEENLGCPLSKSRFHSIGFPSEWGHFG